jgi:hypothetical protein
VLQQRHSSHDATKSAQRAVSHSVPDLMQTTSAPARSQGWCYALACAEAQHNGGTSSLSLAWQRTLDMLMHAALNTRHWQVTGLQEQGASRFFTDKVHGELQSGRPD